MSREVLRTHPDADPALPLSEVTLHVAEPNPYREWPLQWVGGIAVGEKDWWHENAQGQTFDQVTTHLPERMATGLLRFAAQYLRVENSGPDAIDDPRTDYCCHTLAEAIGSTAVDPATGSPYGLENSTVGRIFHTGSKIEPAELAAGEWAVVGHPDRSGFGVSHSMVGIGLVHGGEKTAYTQPMAIQVDQIRGALCIGNPYEYIQHEVRRWQRAGAHVAPPGLYVKR